jgi:hypothetical protein
VAGFDKVILPGGEGKIRLEVKTEDYQENITKTARVYTNEPGKKPVILTMKAFVKAPIIVSSRYVSLYGSEGESITKVVQIRAALNRPLVLTPALFSLGEKLTYTLEEIEEGKRFRIRFKSVPGLAQTYRGFLKLKTNYPEKPELTIRIKGKFVKKKKG